MVTPLTGMQYLVSKVLTLTALSVLENLAVVLLTHGPDFRWGPCLAGMAAASMMFCLIGFIVVARYARRRRTRPRPKPPRHSRASVAGSGTNVTLNEPRIGRPSPD